MTAVADAAAEIEAALKTVPDMRVFSLGDTVQPLGAVVSLPLLAWEAYGRGATTATFTVFLLVDFNDRAVGRLMALVESVADAIESYEDAVVRSASPGVYEDASTQLPCYSYTVEVSL